MIITAAQCTHVGTYLSRFVCASLSLYVRVFVCVNKGNICDSMKQYSGLFCVSFPWWINPPVFFSYFVRIIKLTGVIWHRYELCRIQRNESNRALEHTCRQAGRQRVEHDEFASVCVCMLLLGDFLSITKRQWCLLLKWMARVFCMSKGNIRTCCSNYNAAFCF